MIAVTRNRKEVFLRQLGTADMDHLVAYLNSLSLATRSQFQPHEFSRESVQEILNTQDITAYGAEHFETGDLIAYALIKKGMLEHDRERLESYGLKATIETDATLAPSVADAWQNYGVGNLLLQFILSDLKRSSVNRIFLWGGVQAQNDRAIHFYEKNGFRRLGTFQYQGDNLDMMLRLAE
ncbi:MAG TPA: GNAT family N-acetyltransferase [Flavisolibacter sp.]|jgi:ribosomal protein S18 acetylase RimI-like enzyme|nr:GNAT family N-acetyltransferase [Flavisolibacter sp.]